jgi:two-component system, NarL family, invasion response regulator UvrY
MDHVARVLIVDDHEPFRRAAAAVVASADPSLAVYEAVSGEDAIDRARELTPDLVLMDVHLGGISGVEATRRLLTDRPGTAVLLLSSYEPTDLPADLLECGALAYVHKADLDPAAIRRALADVRAGPTATNRAALTPGEPGRRSRPPVCP